MRLLPNARLARLAALVAVASCADATEPPLFTNLDYLLAESSGALSGLPMRLITAAPPAALNAPFAISCPYDAASAAFVCPVQSANTDGVFNMSYQLLDANNQPLATRDTAATAAIRTVRTSDFLVVLPGDTTHHPVHNVSRRTLSGLLDGERIVNSQDTIIRLIVQDTVYRLVTEAVTVSNFRPRIAGLPSSFPESGTITVQTSYLVPGNSALLPATFVMTFNGSSTVTWTRNLNGVAGTCTYNYAVGGNPTCT